MRNIAAFALAAGLSCPALTSCTFKTNTYGINISVPLGDIDFTDGSCHGISFSSAINGDVVVTCGDVVEPTIRVDVDFGGGLSGSRTAEKRKEERDNFVVTHELRDDGVLVISFVDRTSGNPARSSKNLFKDPSHDFIFSHAKAYVEMTLPRSFDSFDIRNYGGQLGVKDLGGHIALAAYESLTAENIAFNADDDNMVIGDNGVFISTSRYNDRRADALITSQYGDITYVMPEPADMQGSGKADTIQMLCSDGAVTVDLNGNVCADTNELDKEKNRQYDYSVAHGAALLDIESYGSDVVFTNGNYKRSAD